MTNPTFKFLRGQTLYADLQAAKNALQEKVETLQQGEPALVYYKHGTGENEKLLALFGIGGTPTTGATNASGTGIFYNTIEVDSAIAALGAQISGETSDTVTEGLTLYALKNYIESKAGAATTTVVSGNGINVTVAENDTSKAKTYTVAANVELQYVAASTIEGVTSGAKIKLLDKSNTGNTFGTIEVSDIIGNGILSGTSYDENTGILYLTFNTASGTTQTTEVNLGALIDINDVGIDAASQAYLSVGLNKTAAESGGSQAVFAALVQNVSADTEGLADAKDVKIYVDNKIAGLDATVTSTDSAVATVKVDTKGGNVTGVTVTNKSAGVASGKTGETVTLTATGSTAAVLGSDIPTIKSYVDAKVSGKNVTATGDTYVTATAENNKVTIKTNVADFTVSTGGTDDSTITGTEGKLASSKNIADVVTTFTNARISEEIKKLKKDEATVTGTNVSFKYSQANGLVTISGLTVEYTTVTNSDHTGDASAATATFSVTNGEKIAKGSDVSAAATYAKALSTEDRAYTNDKIAILDATQEAKNTIKDNGNDLYVKVEQVDGLITGLTATVTTLDAGTF